MTQSMTAFASVQTPFAETNLCWEIRSVNHRYLDVSFRMPDAWRFLETALREAIRGQIARGKLECQLKLPDKLQTNQTLAINEGLITSLLALTDKVAQTHQLQNDFSLSSLLNWPGVVQVVQPDIEQFVDVVLKLFENGLTVLQTARRTEGRALQAQVLNRLERLQAEIIKAQALADTGGLRTRERLFTRLHSLKLDVDNTRVEQEIALLLTKMDVSEELDRLAMHAHEVAQVLRSSEAAGRHLDFLMQELNREANTLGSKSDTIALTQSAVEMKVLIEQMREQIQNIE